MIKDLIRMQIIKQDSTIDISPYLNDIDNNNSNNNLVTELLNYLIIDNNIFGYTTTGEVILNQMPDELLFNKIDGETQTQIEKDTIININDTIEIYQKNHDQIILHSQLSPLRSTQIYSSVIMLQQHL